MNLQLKNSTNRVFLVLCVTGFFAILSSTMSKSPVLPSFAAYLQTPEGFWTGVVATASTIPGILIALPAGSLSDVLGRRKMLLFSAFVFASAPFLYLLVTIWWQLILVRFYHGFATGMFVPIAEALIAENFPTKRGERISLFSSVTIVGRALAPLLGGSILFVTSQNFHVLYIAVAAAGLTAFMTALAFLGERKAAASQSSRLNGTTVKSIVQSWRNIAKTPGFFVVGLVEASQYYVYGSMDFFFVKYLGHVGVNAFLQGVIVASLLAVVLFSKPYLGRLSDTTGRRTPIIAGCLLSAVPLLAVPFSSQFPVLLFLAMVYGLGFSLVTSSTPALVSELVSMNVVGSAMGFLGSIMDMGQTLGPLVCSLILVTSLGYVGLFASLTIVLVFVGGVFFAAKTGKHTKR